MSIDWGLVANVVFSGIVIVFAVLVLLILMVNLMGKILGVKPAAPAAQKPAATAPAAAAKPAAVAAPAQASGDSDQVVAVISAAVSAYMADEAPGVAYQIGSITPRTGRPKELRPAWGFAGMRQNTEPF